MFGDVTVVFAVVIVVVAVVVIITNFFIRSKRNVANKKVYNT